MFQNDTRIMCQMIWIWPLGILLILCLLGDLKWVWWLLYKMPMTLIFHINYQSLNRFIKNEPDNADSYVGRAMVYAQLGRDEESQSDVIKSIKLGLDATVIEELITDIKARR